MTDSQKWLLLTFLGITAWLIYLLSPILMPFAIAAFLAYLGDPLADKLEAKKLSRTIAVVIVFFVMILVIGLILVLVIPILEAQITRFIARLPEYAVWLNKTVIPWVQQQSGIEIKPFETGEIVEMLKAHWQKAGGVAAAVMGSVSKSGMIIFEWLMNLVLIPVVAFYLLRDWDDMVEKVYYMFPRRSASVAAKLAKETDEVLGAFFRGQFYVMLALGVIYSVGLWIVGLDLALLIGMMAGLVSFVPYLGSIFGIVAACIAALAQFHDLAHLAGVAAVFAVGQGLEGMLLTPWLVGDKIGLHPVAVIFAVLAGGQLFGFVGVLIALPVASVIMIFFRHIHDLYKESEFYAVEGREAIPESPLMREEDAG